MYKKENHVSASGVVLMVLVFLNAVILKAALINNENWYIALLITVPLLFVAGMKLKAEEKFHSSKLTGHESNKK